MLVVGKAQNVCASPKQRTAESLEMHTLVYITVAIPMPVPLGIFGTVLFPGSLSFSSCGACMAGICFLASCGDLLLG